MYQSNLEPIVKPSHEDYASDDKAIEERTPGDAGEFDLDKLKAQEGGKARGTFEILAEYLTRAIKEI